MIVSGSSVARKVPWSAVTANDLPSPDRAMTKMPVRSRPPFALFSTRSVMFLPSLLNSPTLIEAPSAPDLSSKRSPS